jgi:YHS domain-containing protein
VAKVILSKIGHKRSLVGILTFCMFMPMMPHGCSTTGAHQRREEKSQVAGNKICPVSREKINEETKVVYSYKGKKYNFCCSTCVVEFKKDPEKYIKRIEKEKAELKSKQEQPADEGHQHSH